MKEYKTIQEVCKDVLSIQDASNLGAVIKTWGAMQPLVREACDGDSIRMEQHPVQIMMLSKVTSLMNAITDGIGSVSQYMPQSEREEDVFTKAYHWCQDMASHD